MSAGTAAEFVELLRELHVWAGEPSLRVLARRCGPGRIAHSTFGGMLNSSHRLPVQRTVILFVTALGGEEDLSAWVTAWRQLRRQRRGPRLQAVRQTG